MRLIMTLTCVVFLTGCATASNMNKLSVGMTKPEVIRVMGSPDSVAAQGGAEYLEYEHLQYIGHYQHFFVRVVNGKVDAYGQKGDFDSVKTPTTKIEIDQKITAKKAE